MDGGNLAVGAAEGHCEVAGRRKAMVKGAGRND